jgi:hypothetical protein
MAQEQGGGRGLGRENSLSKDGEADGMEAACYSLAASNERRIRKVGPM